MADMLASPSDLASFLQQDVDTATATLLLEGATSIVQTVTGQRIVQVVGDVMVIDLDGWDSSPWLDLPQRPVTAVTSVLVGSTAVTDFTVQLSKGRLWRSAGWRSSVLPTYCSPSTVTVTNTHGYVAGDQRLQTARQATLSLAGSVFVNPSGAVREQIDDYAVAYEAMSARMEAAPALRQLLRKQYSRPSQSARLVRSA
jgi:hypothetical protein